MLKNLTIDINSATYKPTITTTGGALVPYPMGAVYGSRDEIVLSFVDDANSTFPNYTEVSFFASVGGVAFAQTTFTKDGTNWVGVIDWLDNVALGALADRRDVVCRCGFHCVYEGGAVEEWQFPITLFMTSAGYLTDSVEAKRYAGEASEYAEQASEYSYNASEYVEQASEYAEQASEYAYNAGGYAEQASEYAGDASEYAEQASEYAYNASEYAEQVGGRIDCLAQDVSELETNVSGLHGCMTELNGCVSELQGCVCGLHGSLTEVQGCVSYLANWVSGLEGCVSFLANDVSGLYDCVSGLHCRLDTMNCQLFGTCGEFADVRAEINGVSNRLDSACTKIGCVSEELHSGYQKKLVAGDGLYISECSTSASISLCNTEMWCYDEQGGCVNLKLNQQSTGVKYEVNGNTFSAPVISAPLIRATNTSGSGWRADFHSGKGGFYVTADGETRFYGVVQLSPGYVEVRNRVLTASTANFWGNVSAGTLSVSRCGTIGGTLRVNGSCFAKVNPCGVVFGFDDGGFFSDKKDCAGCRNRLFSRGGSDSTTKINCNIEVGESGYTLGQIINAMRQHNFL